MQEDTQISDGAGFSLAFGTGLWSGKKSRVGNGWALGLLAAAGLCDLLGLIPFVGDFVAPVFWIAVSYILWKKGCGFLNFGRLATSLIAMVAKMLPAIQEFPETIIGIVLVILLIRFEDKTGIKVPAPGGSAGGAIEGAAAQAASVGAAGEGMRNRTPLNVNGVRAPADEGTEAVEGGGVSKNSELPLGEEPEGDGTEPLSTTQSSSDARRELDAKYREDAYRSAILRGATPRQAEAIAEPAIDELQPDEAGTTSKTITPKDIERENDRRRRETGF